MEAIENEKNGSISEECVEKDDKDDNDQENEEDINEEIDDYVRAYYNDEPIVVQEKYE